MSSIYCSNCGKSIPESFNFCKYCGAAQHGQASARYRAQAPVRDNSQPPADQSETRHASRAEIREFIKNCQHQKLCPRAKFLFFINYLGATSIVLLLFAIGIFMLPELFIPALAGYFIVLYATAAIVYRNFHYSLSKTGLEKEHGILHKKSVSIPYNRIQNINVTRSLVDRILGISRICIETAGRSDVEPRLVVGRNETYAEGHLPGLTLNDAKELHDILLEVAHSREPI